MTTITSPYDFSLIPKLYELELKLLECEKNLAKSIYPDDKDKFMQVKATRLSIQAMILLLTEEQIKATESKLAELRTSMITENVVTYTNKLYKGE